MVSVTIMLVALGVAVLIIALIEWLDGRQRRDARRRNPRRVR